MRLAALGLVTAAALIAGGHSGSARESFFNNRYCTQVAGDDQTGSGIADCAFHTWEQCIAAARGLGRYCSENPSWRATSQKPSRQRKSGRRNRL